MKPERQYYVTHWELLAMVMFTKQYHSYLAGRQFLLCMDYESLTWLRNFRVRKAADVVVGETGFSDNPQTG